MNHPPSAFASVGHSCRQTMHANADMVRLQTWFVAVSEGVMTARKIVAPDGMETLDFKCVTWKQAGNGGWGSPCAAVWFPYGGRVRWLGGGTRHRKRGWGFGSPPLRSSSTGRHRLGCVGCRHADILDGSVGLVGDVRGMADPVPAHGRRQPRKLSWLTGLSSLQHWRIHVRFR